jgi:pyruvate carboxylase
MKRSPHGPALREFRVRGLSTNLQFLENVVAHPLVPLGRMHHALH